MTRLLTAALTSAALVLSPVGIRPASASGGEELLGLLLGIGTVYAIGKGIEQARAPAPVPDPVPERIADTHRLSSNHAWSAPRRTVPRDCLGTFDTWHGELSGFDRRCLSRSMERPDRLPAMCAIDTRIGHRETTIYSARCLQLEGWDISGRHAGRTPPTGWRGGSRLGP
jgi:hypothetical protein